ncbi:MAG: hypothetical protein A3F84_22180 [Candidatus Handelsmanbacteria bacterium RIFCSPLOWO2_12_FULL_64_10]|uniref:Uroporphyrinogen decarboxylase (URO-D) domain-containing protein n=1 Tax=Handelsmanbacteria sp. (strain RIFCSPLOWO2_12_FULL_64_10) TaxID=1817868 RepID=A0A1F6D4T7_HANXR|nr:MAG: hypothetical protein A3F84_22180 [Candidatus Handelsmanbacteria bacterium RIFCSPLOWO2_12_FULL_64_10]
MAMTPRRRVEAVLRGERPDRVPFTIYETKLPRCEAERRLRGEGVCLVAHSPSVFRAVSPHVAQERITYTQDGVPYVRTNVRTPVGELSSVERVSPEGDTTSEVEWMFKGPEDYRALLHMIRDETYLPDYDAFIQAQGVMGEDGFLMADIGSPPFQHVVESLMGLVNFAQEWMERRDEVLRLYDAVVENRRRLYRVVAGSPALAANYGGNVTSEVVGVKRFEQYYLPHYDEFAEVMHARGKKVGVHFDTNVWVLSEAIGRSRIDYVEGFTPRPDTDMGVAEARCAWPDKVLWVNFPTSVHQEQVEVIEGTMQQVLFEAAPGDRFIMGITERMPPERWRESLSTILRVVRERGELPLR